MSIFSSCEYKKLVNALKRFGLELSDDSNHACAKCLKNGHKTTIPRHTNIKREIVKSICDFLIEKEIPENEILKRLK